MRNIAIFASGSGTNTENIISYFSKSKNISVRAVYCNSDKAFVLQRIKKYHIPAHVFSKNELYSSDIVLKHLKDEKTDLIVLAGFLLLLPEYIIKEYRNRMINIHPSLIPKFCGKGMYGQKIHEAVIAAGERESGITIHYVNGDYDDGDIIFQAKCPVNPEDSAEDLASRIHELEYRYYPEIIEKVIGNL